MTTVMWNIGWIVLWLLLMRGGWSAFKALVVLGFFAEALGWLACTAANQGAG